MWFTRGWARRKAARDLHTWIEQGLWRIISRGEQASDETRREMRKLDGVLTQTTPHLGREGTDIAVRVRAVMDLVGRDDAQCQQQAQLAAIGAIDLLGVAGTDDDRRWLGEHVARGAVYVDGASARGEDLAGTAKTQAAKIADSMITRHRIATAPATREAVIVELAASIRTIETASALRKAEALALLDSVLKDLTRIGPYTPWHQLPPWNQRDSSPTNRRPGAAPQ